MRIHIVGQGFQIDAALRTYMEHRLRFALSRFGSRIGRVHTRLTSCQGSHGGPAIQCCLTVQLLHLQQSRVEVTDADVRVAIDCAIDRTERFVGLALSVQPHTVPAWSKGKA